MTTSEAVSISTEPKEGQLVLHNGKTFTTIREGLAYILVPPQAKTSQDPQSKGKAAPEEGKQPQSVFYNPIQQFNRDLSVLAIRAFGEDLCERRRERYERNYEKLAKRSAKKQEKKRKREADGSSNGTVKAPKIESAEAATNTMTGNGQLNGDATTTEPAESLEDQVGEDSVEPTDQTSKETTNGSKRGPPFRILDALSATGLRALRYAKEIPSTTGITANDMDRKAVQSIEVHLEHNGLKQKIQATTSNALAHMYGVAHPPHESHGPAHISAKYDVIDLDPYGTAAPFLDAAVQALNDGGLLCVTCTDSGVFASCGYAEKTFSLYGGMPAKGAHCHETGLRLILHAIAQTASKYGIAIEPLLSLSIDFYARVFVRIRRSPADVKFLAGKTMIVHECDHGCGAWSTQTIGRNTKKNDNLFKHSIGQTPSTDRLCEHCGSKMHIAGPMWAGPLHHPAFVSKVLEDAVAADKSIYGTTARLEGMLNTALEELAETDCTKQALIPKVAPETLDQQPFFFLPSKVAKVLHATAPSDAAIRGALRHAGYRASRSHCKPGSVKTNAPWSVIWEVMREWVRQKSPVAADRHPPGSPGWKIMGYDKQTNGHSTASPDATAGEPTPANAEEQATELVDQTVAGAKPLKVYFDEALGKDKPGKKLVRYQTNPRENWGPMSRAR